MVTTLAQIKKNRVDLKKENSQNKMIIHVDYGDDHINLIKRDISCQDGFSIVAEDVADFYKILKKATCEERISCLAEFIEKYEGKLYFDEGFIELIEKGIQKYEGTCSEKGKCDMVLCKMEDGHLCLTFDGNVILDVTQNIHGEDNWQKLLNLQKEVKVKFQVEKTLFKSIALLS